jgi:hypothetical protein
MRLTNITAFRTILIALSLSAFVGCIETNNRWFVKKYSNTQSINDSLINSLRNNYDIILMYNKTSSWQPLATCNKILAFKKDSSYRIFYNLKSVRTIYESPYDFSVNNFNKASADTILKRFNKEKIWLIQPVDEGGCALINGKPNLNCSISDAETIHLSIITKDGIIRKDYYAPFYWELECCSGNLERQKFIRCVNSLKSIF